LTLKQFWAFHVLSHLSLSSNNFTAHGADSPDVPNADALALEEKKCSFYEFIGFQKAKGKKTSTTPNLKKSGKSNDTLTTLSSTIWGELLY